LLGSRGFERRLARVAEAAERLDCAHQGRRPQLQSIALMCEFIREFAAPEDAGPGLAKAFELRDAAVAELGYVPLCCEVTAEDLTRLPERPPPEWLALWRRFEHR
jgi:hypothetical protein